MPAKKLKEFLESQHVSFTCIPHKITYTAQETAEAAHVPGYELSCLRHHMRQTAGIFLRFGNFRSSAIRQCYLSTTNTSWFGLEIWDPSPLKTWPVIRWKPLPINAPESPWRPTGMEGRMAQVLLAAS